VPYFKKGLQNNEYCLWITADPLGVDESVLALGKAVDDLSHYVRQEQILITDHKTSYTPKGKFDAQSMLQQLIEMEQFALSHGFDGLRASGNESWLTEGEWESFVNYELATDSIVRRHKIIALCSYPLKGRKPAEIIDVVSGHRLVLIREADGWRLTHNTGNGHIVNLRNSGWSYREIGRRFGLSKQRIAQMLSINRKPYSMSTSRTPDLGGEELLTTRKAAALLGIHVNTMRRWSKNGVIPAHRFGARGDRRFRRADLDKFLGRSNDS
jgi:excisionase family DNA binding protein